MKVTETQIQSIIIRYLSILENQGKLWFTRFNNIPPVNKGPNGTMQFRKLPPGSKKGVPDLIVITKGCFIGLEVKTPTGRQSKEQKEVEEGIKKQDCSYYVVRSLEEVQEILKKFGV
ncbi:MAG: VRR-NUC domain-containing protein [Clostridium sp.]|uniref:VRR-NUC domain-containing protein n=1 Tax=Clostridium sp. TaxID=1506 RepID=UPI003EE68738